MGKRSWDKFTPGDTVGGADVLGIAEDGRLQTELKYSVHWPCCGRTGVYTHSQLAKRHRTGQILCWHCARALRTENLKKHGPAAEPEPEVIVIPLPGLSGRWSLLGTLGPRWAGPRGTDFKVGRGAE